MINNLDVRKSADRILTILQGYQKYGFILPVRMGVLQFYEDYIGDSISYVNEYLNRLSLTEMAYNRKKTHLLMMFYVMKAKYKKDLHEADYDDFYHYYYLLMEILEGIPNVHEHFRSIRSFLEYRESKYTLTLKASVIFDPYDHKYFNSVREIMKDLNPPQFSSDGAFDLKSLESLENIKKISELFLLKGFCKRHFSPEVIRGTIRRFAFFCDMYELPLTLDVAYYWAYEIVERFNRNYAGKYYGIIFKYAELLTAGNVGFSSRNTKRRKEMTDSLPEWAWDYATSFIRYRERLGYEENTLTTDKRCIIRLVDHAVSYGISSFEEMDELFLKYFRENDIHETAEGKNAYLSRIRTFLQYLSDSFSLEPLYLSVFLRNLKTAKEPPKVLDSEFMERMETYGEDYKDEEALRDYAMYLIALRTGLRITDIVKLKFSNILLKERAIITVQKKTMVELRTHMPVEVGNAIYRYVKFARPESDSEYIFLSQYAPHQPLSRSVANTALRRISRNIDMKMPNGFHVIRKTFATERIKKGMGLNKTAAALGHTGTENVKKYVSLDEKRMMKCPLSLEGIEMEEIK